MIAVVILSVVCVLEAVVIYIGRKKLKALDADFMGQRARVAQWLAAFPGKAEVALRREAEILNADIKTKV